MPLTNIDPDVPVNATLAVYEKLVPPTILSIIYNPSAPANVVSCMYTAEPAAGGLEVKTVIDLDPLVALIPVTVTGVLVL